MYKLYILFLYSFKLLFFTSVLNGVRIKSEYSQYVETSYFCKKNVYVLSLYTNFTNLKINKLNIKIDILFTIFKFCVVLNITSYFTANLSFNLECFVFQSVKVHKKCN